VVICKLRNVPAGSGTEAGYQKARLEAIVHPPAAMRSPPSAVAQSLHPVPGRRPVIRVSTSVPQGRAA
jgi:hypothetical protein